MTKEQYLLTCLSEECMEIAQRCSKAIRFGLNECEPGQELFNLDRISLEYSDFIGVVQLLANEGIFIDIDYNKVEKKKEKVLKYMEYSVKQGTLKL